MCIRHKVRYRERKKNEGKEYMISSSVALFSNGKPVRYDGIVLACCVLFFSRSLAHSLFSSLFVVLLFSILFLFLLAPVCHWFSSMATANCISDRIYPTRLVSLSLSFSFLFLSFLFSRCLSLPRSLARSNLPFACRQSSNNTRKRKKQIRAI